VSQTCLGGAVQLGILPQSAPNSGALRRRHAYRNQDAQSARPGLPGAVHLLHANLGLSSGLTHTGVQWTKPNTRAVVFRWGRIETDGYSTNGGKWYAYPHMR
jgi:hypothetical protein